MYKYNQTSTKSISYMYISLVSIAVGLNKGAIRVGKNETTLSFSSSKQLRAVHWWVCVCWRWKMMNDDAAWSNESAEIIHQNAPAEGLVTSKYNTATTSRYNWTWLCDVPALPEADVHMASMGNVEMCTMTWMKIQRSMMMMSTYQDLVWFNFRETIDVREQSVK